MEKEKTGYQNPTMEVIIFKDLDIVTLSTTDNDPVVDMENW